MGGFLNDLASAYANQVGEARYGPNWQEKKRAAQLANEAQAGQNANMASPEQASRLREATIGATEALGHSREETAGLAGDKVDLAYLEYERKLAKDELAANPDSIEGKLKLASIEQKLASAYALKKNADKPRAASAENRDPRSGWSAQYGPDGKLSGYYHPAVGFRAIGTPRPGGGEPLPPGSRPTPLSAGERDALALGSVPIRAGDTMRKALAATRAAEAQSPMDPGTWTGPIAGRVGGAYRGAVDSTGPAGDFDQARAEARSLVYALSGKQINESEQAWLDGILPRLADKGVEQQIERFDRFVNYLRQAKAAGYSDPFAVAQAQFDTQLPSAGAVAGGQPGATPPPPTAAPTPAAPSGGGQSKVINGVVYDKVPGGWQRRK